MILSLFCLLAFVVAASGDTKKDTKGKDAPAKSASGKDASTKNDAPAKNDKKVDDKKKDDKKKDDDVNKDDDKKKDDKKKDKNDDKDIKVDVETVCVKCYESKTKDCQKCKCNCDDGREYVVSGDSRTFPADPKNVPCECKDQYGRLKEDATYVSKSSNPIIGSNRCAGGCN